MERNITNEDEPSLFMKYHIEGIEVEEKPVTFLNYDFTEEEKEADLNGFVLENDLLSDTSSGSTEKESLTAENQNYDDLRLPANDTLTYISEYNVFNSSLLNDHSSLYNHETVEPFGLNEYLYDSTVQGAVENWYECSYCDYRSSKKYHLKRHERRHTSEKRFECSHCGHRFADKWHLERHIKLRHSEEKSADDDNPCIVAPNMNSNLIEYSSTNKSHLESRIKVLHTERKPFKNSRRTVDSNTDSEFVTEAGLRSRKKLYECGDCAYTSFVKYHFDRHVRRHTGEKPFQCEFCAYRSANKSHLQRHMKNIHEIK